MTNDALINGKVTMLDDDEKAKAENFHRNRVAFAFINGEIRVNNPGDDRDHQHWMLEEFGIKPSKFENINRGYFMPGRIQLFIGSHFIPIDTDTICKGDLYNLIRLYKHYMGMDEGIIFNGVHVGKVGEVWNPMITIATFTKDGTWFSERIYPSV